MVFHDHFNSFIDEIYNIKDGYEKLKINCMIGSLKPGNIRSHLAQVLDSRAWASVCKTKLGLLFLGCLKLLVSEGCWGFKLHNLKP